MLFTGPRRADAVKFGWHNLRGKTFNYTRGKTKRSSGKMVSFDMPQALAYVLDRSELASEGPFIRNQYGETFNAGGFGNWMRKVCDRAHLPDRTSHGLRKLTAKFAAERGASDHQLMALMGWTSTKVAQRYTQEANRKTLADGALRATTGLNDLLMDRRDGTAAGGAA